MKIDTETVKINIVTMPFFSFVCANLVIILFPFSSAQCPDVVPPCICATTTLEPVHIICERAPSLTVVLSSIISANNSVKIDVLTLNNTQIFELPSQAFEGFVIAKLQLKKMKLKIVSEDAFYGSLSVSLTDLDLSDNDLTEIPLAIGHLKNLKRLSLAKNKIDTLSAKIMSTWKSRENLLSLDVSGNSLDDKDVAAISSLPNLNDLNLAGNQLTEVPRELLKTYKTSLKNLNLASNRIINIRSLSFSQLENLQSLSLEFNNISKISVDAFQKLTNMLYLYLTGNKLQSWDSELYRPLVNLRNLGMGSSGISEIPDDAFKHLPRLVRLEMSNGAIERIFSNAFKYAPKLHAILLNNNRISQIKENTFRGLRELYTLDLCSNRINSIDDYSFSNLPSLKHLDLSNNELKTLSLHTFNGTFAQSQDTKTFYICKNSWICDDRLNWFRHWMRENLEIVIDKPHCSSMCRQPDWLNNWPIRFPNPPPPNATSSNYPSSTSIYPSSLSTSKILNSTTSRFTKTPQFKRTAPDDTPSRKQPKIITGIAHLVFGQLPMKLRQLFHLNNHNFGNFKNSVDD